ncbi:hypothetical protein GWI33_014518 [Rhynchophorus ferrugineus]|uniref:Uncharacterized protein n=1 Tax=Rhynchophorus ferrugineus TaxID=354439 RepID=A0A834MAL4_RHYFE|nr:hypothetical protein GWI33_014518 [Rhynchophorus ferrugineus]
MGGNYERLLWGESVLVGGVCSIAAVVRLTVELLRIGGIASISHGAEDPAHERQTGKIKKYRTTLDLSFSSFLPAADSIALYKLFCFYLRFVLENVLLLCC